MDAAEAAAPATSGGPVRPGPGARTALRPVSGARVTGGFWHERRRVNAETSIAAGPERLERAGNLGNLRRAAARAGGFAGDFQFQDSDVYKWVEAACWQLADGDAPAGLAEEVERIVALIAAAQEPDGYLQTYYQLGGGERWSELGWGHELYCAGHLVQAAIAHHRATGGRTLLAVALRLADHIGAAFGPGGRVDGVCGHPLIETALAELSRETGRRRYLELAAYFVDRRGHGTLSAGVDRGHDRDPGPAFWQDHAPVREAAGVAGHTVRQLYLLAGVADVAAETADGPLLAAALRLCEDAASTRAYITGGMGARHDWEAFGDPYELPADRAYAETCAAIASVQASWRLALATGRAGFSDLIERTLYNGFLSGVGLDGESWLYVNPLHVRAGTAVRAGDQTPRRTRWFRCACCPPNAMRLLASLPWYVASGDAGGMQLHQYATGVYEHDDLRLGVATGYPWEGRVRIEVLRAPAVARTVSLRLPSWSRAWTLAVGAPQGGAAAREVEEGWLRATRRWRPGDVLVLDLDVRPRLTAGHPRVDAVRGCAAIEYGPLVYCVEQPDQVPGLDLDALALDAAVPLRARFDPGLLGGAVTISAAARHLPSADAESWPPGDGPAGRATARPAELTAIPYALWANREPAAMRVWLPVHRA